MKAIRGLSRQRERGRERKRERKKEREVDEWTLTNKDMYYK